MPERLDLQQLRHLYANDSTARAYLDHCAQRQRNQTETTVDRALSILRQAGHDVTRRDVVRVLKALAELAVGQFINGRRGWESRFVWGTEMIGVGRAAAGEEEEIEYLEEETEDEDEDEGSESDYLTHSFHLRPEGTVEFELPSDLRADEAERLARFISSLPFGDEL